jgi:single-stranded-DNA-specific exonuclease
LKFVVKAPRGHKTLDALAFSVADTHWLQGVEKIRMAYALDINEYNGKRCVQLIIKHAVAG